MDINNARNNLLQRRSKLLSEGLSKNDKIDSSNEDNAISTANNIETQSSKILNQENHTTSQKMVKNRRIGDFSTDDNSDINEMLDIINSNYEEEWENTEEEYNFYNENLNNNKNIKQNDEIYNEYDSNIGSIEEYTKDDNFMLDENEYLAKKQKYEDDENDEDTEDGDADDDTDNTSDDDDDPEFRNKYKEIFELNKQKLSKKAKDAVEEDEKEMTSIIKTFKEKKIKSSRKSLDLKKLRGTFREEELEMNK